MADSKISALAAATLPAVGDEFAINQAGTSKKVDLDLLLGFANPGVNGFRLTLTTALPVTTADVTGASARTVYLTPYKHDRIAVYDGAAWKLLESNEISKALGTLTADKNYDVFVYSNAGTLTIDTFVAWTNDTTRATALVRQDGVWCKTGDLTRRYVGTFRTVNTTDTEDSAAKRFLFNADNRVPRIMQSALESTDSWTYNSGTFRQANASPANQVNFLIGLAEEPVYAYCRARFSAAANDSVTVAGIGADVTNANNARLKGATVYVTSQRLWQTSEHVATFAVGYHYMAWVEAENSGNTMTMYGDDGSPAAFQAGITGVVWA